MVVTLIEAHVKFYSNNISFKKLKLTLRNLV